MTSSRIPYIANVIPGDWNSVLRFSRDVQKYMSTLAKSDQTIYLADLYLTSSTASRLLATDSSQKLVSTDLASWVAGTTNEINITDDGDGTITVGIVDPLIVAKGGTGMNSLTDHSLLVGSGTDPITALGVATNGQLPIGSTGADPVLAELTGTANQVIVTNGAGTITLSTPQDIGTGSSPTFTGLTLSGLTASRLVATDGSQVLISSDIVNWISGTANQIIVTDDADGTVTLSTPQDIHTGASPTFAGLTVTNACVLGSDSVVFQPNADSTTFLQVLDADGGTPILNIDSTNERIGIGTNAPAYYTVEIDGTGTVGLQIKDTTYGVITIGGRYGAIGLTHYEAGSAYSSTIMDFSRARGTLSSPATMQDSDWITKWRFWQHNGSDFEQLGGFVFDAPDVSEVKGRFNFYYYSGGANYILSLDKDNIKIGDADGSDYTDISPSTGYITLNGNARVKKEFQLNTIDFTPGASGATLTNIGDYAAYLFSIGDDIVAQFEVPHDWDSSTALSVYVYWYIDEAYATNSGEVQWAIDWSATPPDATEAIDSPTHTGTIDFGDQNIPATAKYLTESSAGTIAAASLAAGDLVGFTINRVALDDGNNPTAEPGLVHVEVHYTANTLGETI